MTSGSKLVGERYRLGQRIGSGAMGVVWQALDERLHRTVAVKQLLLSPGLTVAQAEEARQRAMREGRIAARLSHPNAITVYDAIEDDGQPWLIMEYLPSRSLSDVLFAGGSLPPEQVARIGGYVASALAQAHQVGIVHRDVKPGNVLLAEDGAVKITDFGISRAVGDVTVTATGMLNGTPAYLAPEMATGEQPAPPSDVFSLGSTLYAAVEGQPPFGSSDNQLATLHAVAAARFPPPSHAGTLAPVLGCLMRPNPLERPTMARARDALFTVASGQAVAIETLWSPTVAAQAPPPRPPRGRVRDVRQPEREPTPATAYQPASTTSSPAPVARGTQPTWLVALLAFIAVAIAAGVGILVANTLMNA